MGSPLPSLEEMGQKLLYNSVIDIWVSLSEEKGWQWYDVKSYTTFLAFLNAKGINIHRLPVCPTEPGKKTELAEEASKHLNETAQAMALRLDSATISTVRTFNNR